MTYKEANEYLFTESLKNPKMKFGHHISIRRMFDKLLVKIFEEEEKMTDEIPKLIEKYEKEILILEERYEALEYEPAPSGEVNESMIPMDILGTEINTLIRVVEDLMRLDLDITINDYRSAMEKIN